MNSLNSIRNVNMPSIRSVGKSNTNVNSSGHVGSFAEVLHRSVENEKVKFSKHANLRLETRNIKLTDNQIGRLDESVKIAKNKGIRNSLVIIDDLSFVVNVKSSTVVTALGQNETRQKVFTNIDGAVVI